MDEVIKQYGGTILLAILASGCLYMFANFWFGEDALLAPVATNIFYKSTDDKNVINTANGFYIVKADGTVISEVRELSATKAEEVANRRDPELFAAGTQNETDQLITDKWYDSTDMIWAVDSDGNIINTAAGSGTDSYFRILSLSQGNGNELISNLSDINSIAYSNIGYSDKKGGAGSTSYTTGSNSGNTMQFFIKDPSDNTNWVTVKRTGADYSWCFHKAGTYCFRVYIRDAFGKTATNTIYISVAKDITQNTGDGNNAAGH